MIALIIIGIVYIASIFIFIEGVRRANRGNEHYKGWGTKSDKIRRLTFGLALVPLFNTMLAFAIHIDGRRAMNKAMGRKSFIEKILGG